METCVQQSNDGEEISVNGTLQCEDVNAIVRTKEINKKMFEEYTPETPEQKTLKEGILKSIEAGIGDFEVYIQFGIDDDNTFSKLEDFAKSYKPTCNSKLGSRNHYNLFLAWQIQTGKKTWQQVCDKKDMSRNFRGLKDDDGTFSVAGGSKWYTYGVPESEFYRGSEPYIRLHPRVAFVVFDVDTSLQ
jgi:hypothetical protein